MRTEQGALRISLIAVLVMSALGIGFGLASGSFAVIFDGVFALSDGLMTLLSMIVASLITRFASADVSEATRARFQRGFWHLEPMMLATNGVVVLAVTIYAIINAVSALTTGGRPMEFGPAVAYAAIVLVMSVVMGWWQHRANRTIGSDFVAMDVKGWVMGGGITASLLVAFTIGYFLDRTACEWLMPYIDPIVLTIIGVVLLPVPIGILRKALADIFLVTPRALHDSVVAVADAVAADEGFREHRTYVSRVGRGTTVEIVFVVDPDDAPRPLTQWDAIRARVLDKLGGWDEHRWLSVSFTTDLVWAE